MNENTGCLPRVSGKIVALIALAGLIVGIGADWTAFTQTLSNALSGADDLQTAVIDWLTAPILLQLQLWQLFILIFVLAGVMRLKSKVSGRLLKSQKPQSKRVIFRDLSMIVDYNEKGETILVNDDVPICGICNGRIISTDTGAFGSGPVNYLKCENGHFVGNEKKYEVYLTDLELERKQAEEKRQERERKGEELRKEFERKLQDKEDGKITQEEFDNWMKTYSEPVYRGRPYTTRELIPPYSAQEFYERVVADFIYDSLRQELDKLEIIK